MYYMLKRIHICLVDTLYLIRYVFPRHIERLCILLSVNKCACFGAITNKNCWYDYESYVRVRLGPLRT